VDAGVGVPLGAGRGPGHFFTERSDPDLYLVPEYRGEHVLGICCAGSPEALSLRVLGSNAPALRLYERHGYVTQGRYSEEFLTNGEFVNDLTMTKALGSGHARGSAV
jgi:hypothetical protein